MSAGQERPRYQTVPVPAVKSARRGQVPESPRSLRGPLPLDGSLPDTSIVTEQGGLSEGGEEGGAG